MTKRKGETREEFKQRYTAYNSMPERKTAIAAYNSSPARKVVQDRYNRGSARKTATAKYLSTPIGDSKKIARALVNSAVIYGRIDKQHCVCGATEVEAHHPDYSQPLKVLWLCKKCHVNLHLTLKRRQTALVSKCLDNTTGAVRTCESKSVRRVK